MLSHGDNTDACEQARLPQGCLLPSRGQRTDLQTELVGTDLWSSAGAVSFPNHEAMSPAL